MTTMLGRPTISARALIGNAEVKFPDLHAGAAVLAAVKAAKAAEGDNRYAAALAAAEAHLAAFGTIGRCLVTMEASGRTVFGVKANGGKFTVTASTTLA